MKSICILIICMFSVFSGFSGQADQLLVLDHYKIPLNKKGIRIGQFITPGQEKVTLVKDTAGFFSIDQHGNISLKKNKVLSPGKPFRYGITVRYGSNEKSFELVKDEFLRNKVVAHRGAWKHDDVHQNSVGALKNAIALGCESSEFDVWLSRDNRVVLNHDHEINNLIVEETDLSVMREIILESGEVMATLEQYIECIKEQNHTRLVLEIKSNKNKRAIALTDSAVAIVHRMKAQAWVDYISFDYDALLRVRALDPTAHTAYLGADRPMDLQKVEKMSGIDYHFSQFNRIERMYERCRMLGFTVNIWTVNDEKIMRELLDMGVDWITTDEPELLLRLVSERANGLK